MKVRIPDWIARRLRPKNEAEILHIREIAARFPQAEKSEQFVVAGYSHAISTNIGDNIQQIAITSALQTLFPDTPIHTVERDSWSEYSGGGLSVMQGWFGSRESFPSGDTTPLWIGTHWTSEMRPFIKQVAEANRDLFGRTGFGARDRKTADFMRTIDSGAYLSRCYSLTLPKRSSAPVDGKVFLVNIRPKWEKYIPSRLLEGAVRIDHIVHGVSSAEDRVAYARALLQRYADEACLVITGRVHCASPCTAMGIPVVAIAESPESSGRMSFLDDLLVINSKSDLKRGRINWNPIAPDIEDLKALMLENLRLSVLASQGLGDSNALDGIRREIAEYGKKNRQSRSIHPMKNTWTREMPYNYDWESRITQMLSLSDIASKKTVCDIGCGAQQAKPLIGRLNPAARYVGFDLHAHCPDTILCDFNNGVYPPSRDFHEKETLALVSGVLEYIYPKNIEKFIAFICGIADSVVLSYNHSDVSGTSAKIWVNDLSQIDILTLFQGEGFRLTGQRLHIMRDGTRALGGGVCLYYFEKLGKWQKRHGFLKRLRLWL